MDIKKSFEPLDCPNAEILILGSMPGDRSIAMNQYYGHPQNRFWRVISNVTNSEMPKDYHGKKEMLLANKIALWDVARNATRKGSGDSAMSNENPNDIEHFIETHLQLKVVAFNGKKAEQLYDKFWVRLPGVNYLSLPSTSPANAAINLEDLCQRWSAMTFK